MHQVLAGRPEDVNARLQQSGSRLLVFPAKFPSPLNYHILPHNTNTSTRHKMPNLHRIPKAIAELESLEDPNLTEIAKKYRVTRRTLENRWKGKTVLMQESVSTNQQALTNAQEKALIQLINNLSNRRLPPTTAIVKNLAEEIRGKSVGKNWTASFVHRHRDVLKS
jgi:hypothetical protein